MSREEYVCYESIVNNLIKTILLLNSVLVVLPLNSSQSNKSYFNVYFVRVQNR